MLVASWMYEAGLKWAPGDGVSAHALRHTAATGVLAGGADIRIVAEMLTHASIATTQIYLWVRHVQLREAMEGRRFLAPGVVVS